MWRMRHKRGLRNFVLAILQRAPRNGAEIMNDMEVMTHGWWRPSPGSVYPLLEEMVQEGTLQKREDGRYVVLNPTNFAWPGAPGPRTPADVVRELSGLTAYLEDLKRSEPTTTEPIQAQLDAVAERLRRLRN
jgi:PadR family transcriptional regulator